MSQLALASNNEELKQVIEEKKKHIEFLEQTS